MSTRIRTDWKRGPPRPHGKRLGVAAWETFLTHLTTMSATEASKLRGMPSRAAFVARRERHKDFDRRAAQALASRKLDNSGRKRLTQEQWSTFLARVDSCCVKQLCRQPGMPSQSVVYKRRKNDAEFAATLAGTLRARWRMRLAIALNVRFPGWYPGKASARGALRYQERAKPRPPGVVFQEQLAANDLYRAAMAAVPAHLNQTARDDIAADMVLAVLEGRMPASELKARAKEFTRAHWKLFGTIGTVSLDAPAYPGSMVPLVETIAAPSTILASG